LEIEGKKQGGTKYGREGYSMVKSYTSLRETSREGLKVKAAPGGERAPSERKKSLYKEAVKEGQ